MSRHRSPAERRRIVLLGYVVGFPLGGMTWHSLQYAMGLAALGHDVWFLEDSHDYATAYDPTTGEVGTDPAYGLAYADRVLERVGLGDRWAYHDAHAGTWHGGGAERILEACRTADVVLDLAGIHPLRPWVAEVPTRVFVDADPVFTQVRHLTDDAACAHAAAHTHHLSFGERVGEPGCGIPDDGFPWRPTRQPVVLDAWSVTPVPGHGHATTVMQWDSYPTVSWDGVEFGMKSASFGPYRDLPARSPVTMELALGRADEATRAALREAGWLVADPQRATWDPWVYQETIAGSVAEWSVAKHGYVASASGWFSERSANYLASGRPVVVQDTGFADLLPTGEGLFAFDDADAAVAALEQVHAHPDRHGRAARAIAAEHFDAGDVLMRLLDDVAAPVRG